VNPPPTKAYLGLGSNIGDRRAILQEAVEALDGVVAVSSLYETDPVGGVQQDSFYNIVVAIETGLEAHELLRRCQSLERAAKRKRIVRWGPRTLDVDILLFGDLVIDTPELTIPHPRMTERNFVMVPLLEVAPDLPEHELVMTYDPASAFGEVIKIGDL
jgi:2-amino-4-hydroxy-6-hydroxymethyldihydropteridine diphosphokinase